MLLIQDSKSNIYSEYSVLTSPDLELKYSQSSPQKSTLEFMLTLLFRRLTKVPPSCADSLEILEAPISWSSKRLSRPVQI